MKKLYLTILWHQHQPYYKDDGDGLYHLPWVYLHALKDYYEMARHIEVNGKVKAVFNYVPSLLIQLEDYCKTDVPDFFLQNLRKDVRQLKKDERAAVASQCFMANTDTMIRPLPRFNELYNKQSLAGGDMSVFSEEELTDLEVMYIISWCGEYMRKECKEVARLIEKGSGFTEDDKQTLLQCAAEQVKKIKDIHKRLADKGMCELSCTPFFHPILPLLADIGSAREAYGEMAMPLVSGDMSADAEWHLKEGLAEFKRQFGFEAKGMWPAEGSISQKTCREYALNGVRWIASDEEVLGNSLHINMKDAANRPRLYQRHFQIHDGNKINIFFRDKELSDLIGFTYSSWKAEDAVKDFMSNLKRIFDMCEFSPHVSVILDGENAWEYYEKNGSEFFTRLYNELGYCDWVETQTFSEAILNDEVPEEIMPDIVAGSWIMGNFRIWIGHQEKNRAWELLYKTRRDMMKYIGEAGDDVKEKVYRELHAAEGSDWFWWFGDDHFSLQSNVFDRLFRKHLVNIRRFLNIEVPAELYRPIKRSARTGTIKKPVDYITPSIDGKITDFYEWQSAGVYDLKADAGSMHSGGNDLKKLLYGFDKNKLYLAVMTDFREEEEKELEIEILGASCSSPDIYKLDFGKNIITNGMEAKAGKICEMAVNIKDEWRFGKNVYVTLKLKRDSTVIEKAPLYSAVEIDITDNFENEWII